MASKAKQAYRSALGKEAKEEVSEEEIQKKSLKKKAILLAAKGAKKRAR